ncbi:MAG: DUF4911 domain-containing protein [Desulfobulbaceae bacterium]|nr:DUF4911 domain-containing protein [Desulfobulbaceae bacterium]
MTTLSQMSSLYLRINPRQIHFLKFLLEGYDGLAILSTVDASKGLVVVRFPTEVASFLFELLTDIAESIAPCPASSQPAS